MIEHGAPELCETLGGIGDDGFPNLPEGVEGFPWCHSLDKKTCSLLHPGRPLPHGKAGGLIMYVNDVKSSDCLCVVFELPNQRFLL